MTEGEDAGLTQYEKDRLERIARNRAMLAGLKIEEASAEFVAPLKAAQQQAKARKRAFDKSFVTAGAPVRRSTRAGAAATTAKLSKQPDANLTSPELSSDEESLGSEGNEPLEPHEAYDPAEEGLDPKEESDSSSSGDASDDGPALAPAQGGCIPANDLDEDDDIQRALALSRASHAGDMAYRGQSSSQQVAAGKPEGHPRSLSKASGQEVPVQGKSGHKQPSKVQAKARAAPKRKQKTGIVQSLAATEAEIEQSFAMLLPSRDGKVTAKSLQQVVNQILGESLDSDESADMIAFANEMAAASSDAIEFPTYVQLAKRIIN
ncbi:hypothetical protein WJX74_008428 [Apatococcus lobatus]|uniref:EF-hand domain-containing protein n=1 Tax=Apatococcus lobatus TaxID=904363 RepID=A0AAW1S5A5_9CHLO